MSGGFYAFLTGVILVIVTFIVGHKKGYDKAETEVKHEVVKAEQKATVAEKEKTLAVDTAKIIQGGTAEKDALNEYFQEFIEKLTEAKSEKNPDLAIEAAKSLAQKAENWRTRNL